MDIRYATLEDLEVVKQLFADLLKDEDYSNASFLNGPVNEENIKLFLEPTGERACFMFNEDKGFVMFETGTVPYVGTKVGRMVAIYAKPEIRDQGLMKRVREGLELWSKVFDCQYVNINTSKEGVDLSKNQYTKFETMWIKEIN